MHLSDESKLQHVLLRLDISNRFNAIIGLFYFNSIYALKQLLFLIQFG